MTQVYAAVPVSVCDTFKLILRKCSGSLSVSDCYTSPTQVVFCKFMPHYISTLCGGWGGVEDSQWLDTCNTQGLHSALSGTVQTPSNDLCLCFLHHYILLLSLDAHNHVDDYSGTLGVFAKKQRKKKSTFQLWSQVPKLLHCLKFLLLTPLKNNNT